MRVLFTTLPQSGHFNPLVPIARALQSAGHEVAVASAAAYAPTIEAAGLRAFPAGYDRAQGRAAVELFPERHAVPAAERRAWVFRTVFAGFEARQRIPDILAIAEAWRPDLIVREAIEFGGCVAAEALGLPHAAVRSATWYYRDRRWVAAALDELRAAHGLPPDPDTAMLYRYLFLAAEPSGFQPPDEPLPPTAHLLRPDVPSDAAGEPPAWLAELPSQPTIYATLGTAWRLNVDVFSSAVPFVAILAGLRDAGVNLIVTLGRDHDPAQFGPQPPHIRVERYVPQGAILPHCAAVIAHGGWNTTMGTLAQGLPTVFLPLGADQPLNAACCAALGVGRVVGPEARTPAAIRAAVRAVLADPAYRTNAERVRDEMAALPGPEYAVALLERLAAEKQPILAAP